MLFQELCPNKASMGTSSQLFHIGQLHLDLQLKLPFITGLFPLAGGRIVAELCQGYI